MGRLTTFTRNMRSSKLKLFFPCVVLDYVRYYPKVNSTPLALYPHSVQIYGYDDHFLLNQVSISLSVPINDFDDHFLLKWSLPPKNKTLLLFHGVHKLFFASLSHELDVTAYLDEPDDHTHSTYSSEDLIAGQEICYAVVTASRPDSLRYLGN